MLEHAGAEANSQTHAPGDGIVTAGFIKGTPVVSNGDIIVGNTAKLNDGAGIDLLSTRGTAVVGNTANNNGIGSPSRPNASSGSGVILAAGGNKGGVWNNTIASNQMTGNGHGGVALHAHTKGPRFTGNRIINNTFGRNNVRTDYRDRRTTGVYIGSVGTLRITVAGNLFKHNAIGVFTAGPVRLSHGLSSNAFQHIGRRLVKIARYKG